MKSHNPKKTLKVTHHRPQTPSTKNLTPKNQFQTRPVNPNPQPTINQKNEDKILRINVGKNIAGTRLFVAHNSNSTNFIWMMVMFMLI